MNFMNELAESQNPERDAEMASMFGRGESCIEIGKKFNLTSNRVRIVINRQNKSKVFLLVLDDGQQRIPVAKVTTSRGFLYACKMAVRAYSGLFSSLSLPTWKLKAGDDSIDIKEIES